MTEYNINNVLSFISANLASMNDTDYLDAMFIVSQRLENDRYYFELEKNPGFVAIKEWIIQNFDRVAPEANNVFLSFLFQTNVRGLRVFNRDQTNIITQKTLEILERKHSNMSLVNYLINLARSFELSKSTIKFPIRQYE